MASFRDIRNLLVESFDDDDISEDVFLLLYDANTSKNPDFPYDCYGSFDLNDMDDSRRCAHYDRTALWLDDFQYGGGSVVIR